MEKQDPNSKTPSRKDLATISLLREKQTYLGLDRMTMLVGSIGMLRIIFANAVNTHTGIDAADCNALAAFVTLLEDDLESLIEELYSSSSE